MGFLEVVIPPDILNDDDGSSNGVALEGGAVRLRCDATGVPEPSVVWKRDAGKNIVFRHEGREKKGMFKQYFIYLT